MSTKWIRGARIRISSLDEVDECYTAFLVRRYEIDFKPVWEIKVYTPELKDPSYFEFFQDELELM